MPGAIPEAQAGSGGSAPESTVSSTPGEPAAETTEKDSTDMRTPSRSPTTVPRPQWWRFALLEMAFLMSFGRVVAEGGNHRNWWIIAAVFTQLVWLGGVLEAFWWRRRRALRLEKMARAAPAPQGEAAHRCELDGVKALARAARGCTLARRCGATVADSFP